MKRQKEITEVQFLRTKDFFKLGFKTYPTCALKYQAVRKHTGKKDVHYTHVAEYFGISPEKVYDLINAK